MADGKPARDVSVKFKENIDFLDALLADLQNTSVGSRVSAPSVRDPSDPPPPIPTQKEQLSNGSARNTTTSIGANLSELDSLLDDLNATTFTKGKYLLNHVIVKLCVCQVR